MSDAAPGPLASTSSPLRFGPSGRFELQPAERRLLVDGRPAALGARALDVLIALAAQPDHLLTKNELLDRVWPGLVVEEANLQVQISNLRKLLGGDVIATVPGRGYRFIAAVDGVAPARPMAQARRCKPRRRPSTDQPAGRAQPLYGRDDDLALVRGLVAGAPAGHPGRRRRHRQDARRARRRRIRCSAEYRDGVWLVELAPLADPALLPCSVAQALGPAAARPQAPLDELVAALEPQRLLLVLDNCEHLLEAASLLAQALLTRTPHVRLLVTSQEPLRLPGRAPVPPRRRSACRARTEAIDPDGALDFGAVRLFVERVQALDPRFRLDAQHAAAVADICRHLDGLALAIELAAARVPSLGVQGVRDAWASACACSPPARASRCAATRRCAPRSTGATACWPPSERAVFRRLGVFSGGCTVEAAQQVAGDEQLDEWAVLDHLAALVDKSLVVADGDDRPRYRLLESARAYALEKLAEADETQAAGAPPCRVLRGALPACRPIRCMPARRTEDAFIAERGVELDNLRAALAWALGDARRHRHGAGAAGADRSPVLPAAVARRMRALAAACWRSALGDAGLAAASRRRCTTTCR